MSGMFDGAMKRSGLEYVVYRDDQIIGNTRGLAPDKGVIQLMSTPIIKDGDKLFQPMMDKYYLVTEASPIIGSGGKVEAWEATYETPSKHAVPTISIGAIHGQAVVGSQHHFSVNQGVSVEELRALILAKPVEDHAILNEMADEISKGSEIKQGSLKRFGSVLAKYSDIAVFAGKLLLAFALG